MNIDYNLEHQNGNLILTVESVNPLLVSGTYWYKDNNIKVSICRNHYGGSDLVELNPLHLNINVIESTTFPLRIIKRLSEGAYGRIYKKIKFALDSINTLTEEEIARNSTRLVYSQPISISHNSVSREFKVWSENNEQNQILF